MEGLVLDSLTVCKTKVTQHFVINVTKHKTSLCKLTCFVIQYKCNKNCNTKIGMNNTANKLHHVNNLIGLDMLNLSFVHFKKLAKIQFLKNG